MATAHTWSGIKIIWKGMEWIAQRDGLQCAMNIIAGLSAASQLRNGSTNCRLGRRSWS